MSMDFTIAALLESPLCEDFLSASTKQSILASEWVYGVGAGMTPDPDIYLCEAFGGASPKELELLFRALAELGKSVILVWTADFPFPAAPTRNLFIFDVAASGRSQCSYAWDAQQFGPSRIGKWKPWAQRTILASFIGSQGTHRSRQTLFDSSISDRKGVVIKGVDWWIPRPADELHAFRVEARSHYTTVLENSRFAFCPRGNGVSSIRRWEAAYCGAVPILIDDFTIPWGVDMPLLRFTVDEACPVKQNSERLMEYLASNIVDGPVLQEALGVCLTDKFDVPAVSPAHTATRHIISIAAEAWAPAKGFSQSMLVSPTDSISGIGSGP